MKNFQVAYIPIGVPTFHLESAQAEYEKSVSLLTSLTAHLVYPDKMLLTLDDLQAFLDDISPDLIILQNATFAHGAYTGEILRRFSCPVLLWTLREPVIDGGRLRLNSLTGAYSAGSTLNAFGRAFEYVYGAGDEPEVSAQIGVFLRAGGVRSKLKTARLAAIGHTPPGFGFGRALDNEIQNAFGVTLESIEVRELIGKAKAFTEEECAPFLERAEQATVGLCGIPAENQAAFARLYKAYTDYAAENKIDALSTRCWPDFFTEYGTPPCTVLSLLNDSGVVSACEADVYGSLSMYIGTLLTEKPTFFGDPVSLDERENTVTYWHCGMSPCSLARKDTGAKIGVHPNRKIGPVMDFGCEAWGEVTVFRVGKNRDGSFRFFIAEGEAIDKPKQFDGTSVVVRMQNSAKEIVTQSVSEGWEPHFVVVFGAVAAELKLLGKMLQIETQSY
ncbi:MAG: fucose isomerase [Oscillospiraceae bacterium]|nr:fucose isomerase [Oscillospiraceae bacterium]